MLFPSRPLRVFRHVDFKAAGGFHYLFDLFDIVVVKCTAQNRTSLVVQVAQPDEWMDCTFARRRCFQALVDSTFPADRSVVIIRENATGSGMRRIDFRKRHRVFLRLILAPKSNIAGECGIQNRYVARKERSQGIRVLRRLLNIPAGDKFVEALDCRIDNSPNVIQHDLLVGNARFQRHERAKGLQRSTLCVQKLCTVPQRFDVTGVIRHEVFQHPQGTRRVACLI